MDNMPVKNVVDALVALGGAKTGDRFGFGR